MLGEGGEASPDVPKCKPSLSQNKMFYCKSFDLLDIDVQKPFRLLPPYPYSLYNLKARPLLLHQLLPRLAGWLRGITSVVKADLDQGLHKKRPPTITLKRIPRVKASGTHSDNKELTCAVKSRTNIVTTSFSLLFLSECIPWMWPLEST